MYGKSLLVFIRQQDHEWVQDSSAADCDIAYGQISFMYGNMKYKLVDISLRQGSLYEDGEEQQYVYVSIGINSTKP